MRISSARGSPWSSSQSANTRRGPSASGSAPTAARKDESCSAGSRLRVVFIPPVLLLLPPPARRRVAGQLADVAVGPVEAALGRLAHRVDHVARPLLAQVARELHVPVAVV